MKKLLLIFLIILKPNFSFSEIVPCKFEDSRKELADAVIKFIDQNS